ncbi:MAG: NAD(P)-binding protein [Candidatus Eremiobacteraeota bacterium]|nr:NAD(P)-binding protein [Candidatus Eremiobacteraeota bacterium]
MIEVVGGGMAGLMTAACLAQGGHPVLVYDHGQALAPPAGLVHLFAGRTFRRHPLEVKAFSAAVDYWRGCPQAVELVVVREPNPRLLASAGSPLPPDFAPRRQGGHFTYSPAFVVDTPAWLAQLRGSLTVRAESRQAGPGSVVATGPALAGWLEVDWDQTSGSLWTFSSHLEHIYIGTGYHLAPQGSEVVAGGNLEAARSRLGATPHRQWKGRRLTPRRDHWPVLGWHRDRFLIGGLGSRGLFWMPYLAPLAALAIAQGHNDTLPPELSVSRLA